MTLLLLKRNGLFRYNYNLLLWWKSAGLNILCFIDRGPYLKFIDEGAV